MSGDTPLVVSEEVTRALVGALLTVKRVLEEGQPAICCTVWVPDFVPETLLDHVDAALAEARGEAA